MIATEEPRGIVACAAYAEGRRVGDIEITQIAEVLRRDGTFVWLGLYEPDEWLMREVQHQFGLHDLAVEDAHSAHQRPKVEFYGESLFVVLRTARWDPGDDAVHYGETHVFLGERYLVSVRHGASETYRPARTACEKSPHLLRKGPGFALYALTDFVVDHYLPVVEALEEQMEALEEELFQGTLDRVTTVRLYALKQQLVRFRRAVAPMVEVCRELAGFRSALIPEDIRPYFRDVHDHALRISEALDGLREMQATALQVSLTLASMRQNDVTKKLAGWGAILALPTMAFSVYGMNFESMPELHWTWGYPTLLGVVGVACGLLYRKLKRAGWL